MGSLSLNPVVLAAAETAKRERRDVICRPFGQQQPPVVVAVEGQVLCLGERVVCHRGEGRITRIRRSKTLARGVVLRVTLATGEDIEREPCEVVRA